MPRKRAAARISTDSLIRQAKALLGKNIIPLIKDQLILPVPPPFTGITMGKTTKRFRPEVNPALLFRLAAEELGEAEEAPGPDKRDKRGRLLPKPKITLKETRAEQWKAFALVMLAGLRRAEADCLTWGQVDLAHAQIRIEATPHFSPKTPESERVIDLSPDAVEIIRQFKSLPRVDPVFVLNGMEARPGIDR